MADLGLGDFCQGSSQFSCCKPEMFTKWRVLSVTRISCRERAIAAIIASISPVGLPILLNSA